jgi:hypothetical protein
VRRLLLGGVLLGACVAPSPTTATPEPSPPFNVSFGASPTAGPTGSPVATSAFAVDASAQWPVLLYEADGGIIRQRTKSAAKELARPCGAVRRLEARPAGLLAWCQGASSDLADLVLVSLPDGRVTPLAAGTRMSWSADVSPDGRSVAAFRAGACVPGPPVCQTRAVLIDVATATEREILPSGHPLGATLEWNDLGLTLFQPECAEAGCAGPGDKSGTFIWDGSAFKKSSDLRFVAKSGEWMLLERLRSFGAEPRTAIIRGPAGESVLSAGHALSISDEGAAIVWVPGATLTGFAPDGRLLWQANFTDAVLRTIGPDAVLAVTAANKLELYDLKRLLRFPIDVGAVVTGIRPGVR